MSSPSSPASSFVVYPGARSGSALCCAAERVLASLKTAADAHRSQLEIRLPGYGFALAEQEAMVPDPQHSKTLVLHC